MSYGVTDDGFIAKTLSEIQTEIDEALKAAFGNHINTLPQSVFGQLKGIFSEREYLLWELAEDVYNSQYPDTSENISLDNVLALTGLTRLAAQYSIIENQALFGTEGTLIPEGTYFSKENDADTIFETTEGVTLGAGRNAVQTISIATVPSYGGFNLTFNSETSERLGYDADAQTIENALNNLDSLSEVSVAGSWASNFVISFIGADGLQPQVSIGVYNNTLSADMIPLTPIIDSDTISGEYQASVECRATITGPLTGDAKTINQIDNPISGLIRVFNAEAVIAGRDEETDAEARIRRNNRLQISEAGPLEAIRTKILQLNEIANEPTLESVVAFENTGDSVDERGLPANSFEIVVYQENGVTTRDDEIAQAIWDAKPAGIRSYGRDISIAVTDTQGFDHIISFSRPTEINIWAEIDITTNNDYPSSGDADIKNDLADWGNSLGVGQDIIVYPQLMAIINNTPGITDVIIRIGVTENPTLDDNIIIDDGESGSIEISRWSTARITVNS